ncbi:MAG: diguanylate cyclase [Rubrivivax sp.]|nr:diguanylate cyclase [Rubrivivax sp.]
MIDQPPPAATRWRERVRAGLAACWRLIRLHTLKSRLAAGGLLAMLVGMGSAVWYAGEIARQGLLEVTTGHEQVEAARTAAIIGRRVAELQRALRVTAAAMDPSMLPSAASVAEYLQSQAATRAMFGTLAVVDAGGRLLVSLGAAGAQTPGISVGDRVHIRRTLQERRAVVSEPVLSRLSDLPVVIFTQPIFDGGGRVAGVLTGSITLTTQDLLQDIVDSRDDDRDTLIVVSDAHGRIVAHPQRARVMQLVDTEPRLARAVGLWISDGRPLVRNAGAWADDEHVVAMAADGNSPWHVWRSTPARLLAAPLQQASRRAVWVVGALALLLSTLLVWNLARQLEPLADLERRSMALLRGDDHSPWPDADGEIGSVVQTLRHVWAERAQTERINANVLARLSSVMAAAPVGLAFTRNRTYELVSAELCRMLGRSEDSLVGHPGDAIFASHDDYLAIGARVAAAFAQGEVYTGDWRLLRADGSQFWGRLLARPVVAADPSAGTIWSVHDVTEQVEDHRQLQHAATHDALTGVLNRKGFEQAMAELMAQAVEPAGSLVMIDLDRFKPINDSAGHAAGDAVLRAVAAAMQRQVRASDVVGRLGGDEFALLLRGCDERRAVDIADKVRLAIECTVVDWDGRPLSVGASLGVSAHRLDLDGPAQWLAMADDACYAAKRAGGASVHVAQPIGATIPAALH